MLKIGTTYFQKLKPNYWFIDYIEYDFTVDPKLYGVKVILIKLKKEYIIFK